MRFLVRELPRPSLVRTKTGNPSKLVTNFGFLAPFSCLHKGNWYREREKFREGPDDCSECICENGKVNCNDESCPRSTTTTTTTPAPTTPFSTGPKGDGGYTGERGEPGEGGIPVRKLKFLKREFRQQSLFLGKSWNSWYSR